MESILRMSSQLRLFCLSSSATKIQFSVVSSLLSCYSKSTLLSKLRQSSLSMYISSIKFIKSLQMIACCIRVICHNQMNIFYFVNRWPKSKDSAVSDKVLSVIETFINLGHQVCLLSPDTNSPDSSPDLQGLPIETVFVNPKKIGSSLASAGKKPDLVLFNNYRMEQMYSIFLYSKWNKCPRILQINRLYGLEAWRKKNYVTVGSPFIQQYDAWSHPPQEAPLSEKFSEEELQSIKRSDYYFCGNDFISHYIKKNLKLRNFIIHSMGLPAGDFRSEVSDLQYRDFKHRKHFVFLGSLNNEKNIDMINALIDIIWPPIRSQLSNAQLHIYGSGYNKALLSKKKELEKQGIIFKGLLEDTQQLQRYKALLYPAQYTSGSKGAIVEAWFQHTPVVTTPIGAEGLFLQTVEPMFSADSKGNIYSGFFKERVLTKEEQLDQKKLQAYYQSGKLSDAIKELNFGGLCTSFTYAQFIENAIKIYKNEQLWNDCLAKSRTSFLKHHCESQMEINLSFGLSQVELSVYESRRKKEYNEEWDKYIKSKQGYNKLHQKNK